MSIPPRMVCLLLVLAAMTASAAGWPREVPGLPTSVKDPGDGRNWELILRLDTRVTVIAAARRNALGVIAIAPRAGAMGCEAMVRQELKADPALFREEEALVFRGPLWGTVYRKEAGPFGKASDEFVCLQAGGRTWLLAATADHSAGAKLEETAAMAMSLALAVQALPPEAGAWLRMHAAGWDIAAPAEDSWYLFGRDRFLPFPADTISQGSNNNDGALVSVSTVKDCASAWGILRTWVGGAPAQVARPPYVPEAFGPNIWRISTSPKVREVYCMPHGKQSLFVVALHYLNNPQGAALLRPLLQGLTQARPVPPASR